MGIIKAQGSCKWCAQGECWSHGGGGKVMKQMKKGGGKGARGKGLGCKWCAGGQCWTHGGGRQGGGKGGGKAGGQWLFVPDSGSFGGRSGKGKGKQGSSYDKTMDKLGKIDADRKVWVGGLPKDATWKQLEKHFEEVCGTKPKVTEVMRKGTGCCAFKTADEASSAISAVNGSDLEGSTLEVDVWTEKEKKEGGDRPKRKFGAAFAGGKKENINAIDASQKVWIGGLAEKTQAGKLKKHFADNGCAGDVFKILKPGTACGTFKTDAEATSAISALNGTELDGKSMEVDVWAKQEKKEKKVKKEE